jgi:phage tail sheath protein FI
MAGLVVATDRASGPWKAPVNVALSSVLAPAIAVNDAQQPAFNVDPVSGKSINVIRALPGRGVRPWAGRTLAGNDAEYRYISVRRTVTHVESSIRRALAPFVFEPNDVATWQRVQAMVDDFLQALWRAGALQGARPRDAYAVRIGVGTTMTEQDVRDGVLHLQVLLALVRPAEFIAVGVTQRMPVP